MNSGTICRRFIVNKSFRIREPTDHKTRVWRTTALFSSFLARKAVVREEYTRVHSSRSLVHPERCYWYECRRRNLWDKTCFSSTWGNGTPKRFSIETHPQSQTQSGARSFCY